MNTLTSALISIASSGLAATVVGSLIALRIKRIEKVNSEKLEEVRDLLAQQRDSRQARISLGRFASEKAVEIEFKAIQDIYTSLVLLQNAQYAVRPVFDRYLIGETQEERVSRFERRARSLELALRDTQTLLYTIRLFLPDDLYQLLNASVVPAREELADLDIREDPFESAGIIRAQNIRDRGAVSWVAAEKALRDRLDHLKHLPDELI